MTMIIHVHTESGSIYEWDTRIGVVCQLAGPNRSEHLKFSSDDDSLTKASALVFTHGGVPDSGPVVGERWEIVGWPGTMHQCTDAQGTPFGPRSFSPWCSNGPQTILTSKVEKIYIYASGVTLQVSDVTICPEVDPEIDDARMGHP